MKELQIAPNSQGKLVSIYDVKSGGDCDCYCPECKGKLIAKNKNKGSDIPLKEGQKIAHFAHDDGSICPNAKEAAIHLLAKEVLKKYKTLQIPSLYKDKNLLSEKKTIKFDRIDIEKSIYIKTYRIQPDVTLYKGEKKLLIEFYNTHKVDAEKIERIKEINESCIEINVNGIEPIIDGKVNYASMRKCLEKEDFRKIWLHNSQRDKLYDKFLKNEELKEQERIKQIEYSRIQYENQLKEKKKKRSEARKDRLLKKGYVFLKVYEYTNYEFDTNNSKEENVYCPKIRENGKDKIDLYECEQCEYFFKNIIYYDYGKREVACGFRNKLIGKFRDY